MSVLLEFAMFPTDKGDSVSKYVGEIIKMIDNSKFDYKLTAMGTIVETESLEDALGIINSSYKILEPYANRVYSSIKLDIRKAKSGRLEKKIQSIESKIGKVKK